MRPVLQWMAHFQRFRQILETRRLPGCYVHSGGLKDDRPTRDLDCDPSWALVLELRQSSVHS